MLKEIANENGCDVIVYVSKTLQNKCHLDVELNLESVWLEICPKQDDALTLNSSCMIIGSPFQTMSKPSMDLMV